MADRRRSVGENVPGDFFVDETCIDCDACRQIAPAVFAEGPDHSFVYLQPQTSDAERAALRALLACPTGSIGTLHPDRTRAVKADFPMRIDGDVYYCGFNSQKSFGGNSYFVARPGGNWLIDSPKFLPHLVSQFEKRGGLATIFLTHRDDVADAEKYARHFAARRIIHRLELAAQPDAEVVLDGFDPVELAPGFVAVPTPGHTRGHMCLHLEARYLFTGDHLWWSRTRQSLNAGHDVCWYSWPEQAKSMAKMTNLSFEWVLPGHGEKIGQRTDVMQAQIRELVQRMRNR